MDDLKGFRFEYKQSDDEKTTYISYGGGTDKADACARFMKQQEYVAKIMKLDHTVIILKCEQCSTSYKSMCDGLSRD